MADDVIVKKEVRYEVDRKSDLETDIGDAADKAKAAAKAVANKADDAYRDLKIEYEKEKIKQKLD